MSAHQNDTHSSPEELEKHDLTMVYMGTFLSLVLTLIPFALVVFGIVTGMGALVWLSIFAVIQLVVQFYYFLHFDLSEENRDNLYLLIFTFTIMFLMVAGTLWLLYDQHARM